MAKGYKWSQASQRWVKQEESAEIKFEERDDGESWAFLISLWRWYPDYLLDLLEDENGNLLLTVHFRGPWRLDWSCYRSTHIAQ